jgi:hypothetical protein
MFKVKICTWLCVANGGSRFRCDRRREAFVGNWKDPRFGVGGLDVLAATEVLGGSFVALQETQTYRNVCNGVL